jgi:hypothetical protein
MRWKADYTLLDDKGEIKTYSNNLKQNPCLFIVFYSLFRKQSANRTNRTVIKSIGMGC